jgi:RNA polymerase sigma-70 factor (ECF subfamily)
MTEEDLLVTRFEVERPRLRALAFRMLGSLSEADDAVQESWLRLSRSGAGRVENLGAWLTTIVARVCLNMLRARHSRREDPLPDHLSATRVGHEAGTDPEHEAVLADSVGIALLVVLQTLTPAERIAFVLHDTFAMPFDEIAPLVGRTTAATRQLASRARRRVRGTAAMPPADLARHRDVVTAFLAASRHGDFDAMLAVLDPDIVFRIDRTAARGESTRELRGATNVARGALAWSSGARFTQVALVNGAVGAILAPQGRLFGVGLFTIRDGRIIEMELVADPDRLREFTLAMLPERDSAGHA